MKIGIIGSGNVGGRLGTRWAQEGHQVRFGVRDPQSAKAQELVAAAGNDASAGTLQQTVDFADMLPGARVVKAFNSIGANNLEDPTFDGERSTMLIAGDDADAKAVVSSLATDLGFEPVDAGPHAQSGVLETLAGVWVKLSRSLGRDFAFRVIRR